MTKNLWGKLPDAATIKTPLLILKEQAALLSKETKGMLEGRVKSSNYGTTFLHELQIMVPTLNKYTVSILFIRHDIELYPCAVSVRAFPPPPHFPSLSYTYDSIMHSTEANIAAKESELNEILESHLQSDRVRNIIQSLLAQAKAS